jgi:hypothetical protein
MRTNPLAFFEDFRQLTYHRWRRHPSRVWGT